MTINKFQGKTQEEAIAKAKEEFGERAVIMNIREVKPKGLFRAFKNSTFEVTAAMEEKEHFSNAMQAAQMTQSMAKEGKLHDMINLAADEPITIPKLQEQEGNAQATRQEPARMPQSQNLVQENEEKKLEERLEVLSDRLEKSLGGKNPKEPETPKGPSSEELNFVRILYSTLLKNEVSEQYVNQILGEIEKFIRPGHSVDTILSNVYQKLILRFGQPKSLDLSGAKPHVVFFIGPTGVGKTTTIAKIASKYKVDYEKKVAFITADTYRIAATEQLQVYANILDAPMSIVYSKEELNEAIEKYAEYDLVFVDTAGFSHKNEEQKEDIRNLIQGVSPEYTSEVYLVLSATTKYRDLLDIVDTYRTISEFKLIFTKLDETSTYGNLLNIKLYSDAELSYTTNGQNVPDDIELFDTQKIVKQLLGGNSIYFAQPFFKVTNQGSSKNMNRGSIYLFLQNSLQLPDEWILSLDADYQSEGNFGAMLQRSYWGIDAGIRKTFFNKRLTLGLQANDLWNSRYGSFMLFGPRLTYTKKANPDSRSFSLNLSYRFNAAGKAYKGKHVSEQDLKRL